MPSVSEQRALLERMQIVADTDARAALIERIATAQRPLTIAFLNQHAFNVWNTDAEFRAALAEVDILLRDGIGISVAQRLLGLPSGLNMNGTDFIPLLIQTLAARPPAHATAMSAYAFGTRAPWLERGAQVLFGTLAAPVQRLDGFVPEATYTKRLAADSAAFKLVVLAMGMPKQERVAAQLKAAADGATIIICGGAILDFCAGKVRRAPLWIRYLRMEWLFRLALEPRRLFSRYVGGGLRFAASLLHLSISRLLQGAVATGSLPGAKLGPMTEEDTLVNKQFDASLK